MQVHVVDIAGDYNNPPSAYNLIANPTYTCEANTPT